MPDLIPAKKRQPKKRGEARKAENPRQHVDEIINRIIGGESLRSICAEKKMPDPATFLKWVANDEKLEKRYTEAQRLRADFHHEEMQDIADNGSNDWMERLDKDGVPIGWQLNGEAVARSKLRLEQRRWSAARMAPKKYGDKVGVEHSGQLKVTLPPDDLGL